MYTIKDVSEKMKISEHTLRFWSKSGFFPFVQRDKNNTRIFSEEDLNWIKIVKCLRATGIDNKSIKQYIEMCIAGDSTIPQRYEIIKKAKEKALNEISELNKQLEMLEYKENYYKDLIQNKHDDIWNPIHNKN